MTSPNARKFKRNYKKHPQHLKLKGLQPKAIEAYARAIRRIGDYFKHDIDDMSKLMWQDFSG
jgi:integrase/recombinase XerD